MKNTLFTAIIVVSPIALVTTGANAFDWTGFYVGAHGGYGWGTDDVTTTLEDETGTPYLPSASNSFDVDGLVGGVQIGGNVQFDQFVLGFEGKYSVGTIDGEFNFDPLRPEAIAGGSLTGLASISGRVGVALDSTLIYARGGYAVTWNEGFANNVWSVAPAEDVATGSGALHGFVAGLGVEHAMTDQLTVGLDYSYYGFQRGNFEMVSDAYPDGTILRAEPELNLGVISASLNYHF